MSCGFSTMFSHFPQRVTSNDSAACFVLLWMDTYHCAWIWFAVHASQLFSVPYEGIIFSSRHRCHRLNIPVAELYYYSIIRCFWAEITFLSWHYGLAAVLQRWSCSSVTPQREGFIVCSSSYLHSRSCSFSTSLNSRRPSTHWNRKPAPPPNTNCRMKLARFSVSSRSVCHPRHRWMLILLLSSFHSRPRASHPPPNVDAYGPIRCSFGSALFFTAALSLSTASSRLPSHRFDFPRYRLLRWVYRPTIGKNKDSSFDSRWLWFTCIFLFRLVPFMLLIMVNNDRVLFQSCVVCMMMASIFCFTSLCLWRCLSFLSCSYLIHPKNKTKSHN